MPEITVPESTIDIDVFCDACGEELVGRVCESDATRWIEVKPCPKCLGRVPTSENDNQRRSKPADPYLLEEECLRAHREGRSRRLADVIDDLRGSGVSDGGCLTERFA